MSDYEIEESLQLRQQRFTAAMAFATTEHEFVDKMKHVTVRHATFDEAIKMADEMIAKLEAPTR